MEKKEKEQKLEELNAQKENLEKKYETEASHMRLLQGEIAYLERYFVLKNELELSQNKLNQMQNEYQKVISEINKLSQEEG